MSPTRSRRRRGRADKSDRADRGTCFATTRRPPCRMLSERDAPERPTGEATHGPCRRPASALPRAYAGAGPGASFGKRSPLPRLLLLRERESAESLITCPLRTRPSRDSAPVHGSSSEATRKPPTASSGTRRAGTICPAPLSRQHWRRAGHPRRALGPARARPMMRRRSCAPERPYPMGVIPPSPIRSRDPRPLKRRSDRPREAPFPRIGGASRRSARYPRQYKSRSRAALTRRTGRHRGRL